MPWPEQMTDMRRYSHGDVERLIQAERERVARRCMEIARGFEPACPEDDGCSVDPMMIADTIRIEFGVDE